jgi:cytochrome c oxidase subunit 2
MKLIIKAIGSIFALMSMVGAALLSIGGIANAAKPEPWAIWHQEAGSAEMRWIEWFDLYTLWFIVPIVIFVLILLIYVVVKFRAKANPNPSKTSHHTPIEIIWTLGPVLILVALAIPSFQLLTHQLTPPANPDLTVKAVGYQWYWGYEYQDESELSYESVLIGREKYSDPDAAKEERAEYGKEDEEKYPYLLAVDNELVVPVNKTIRVLVTAADVIHDFALPAFGLKIDAVPGRTNETWFRAEKEGLYYGQCSELCGKDHAFMPIAIRVVSEEQFAEWQKAAAEDVGEANKALMVSIDTTTKTIQTAGN